VWELLHLFLLAVPLAASTPAEGERPRWVPVLTLQTGLSPTFQLNLGGIFGGLTWQNRATFEFNDIWKRTDAILLHGFSTKEVSGPQWGWTMGAAYRFPAWRHGNQGLVATAGWQRWQFPKILSGTSDNVLVTNVLYRTKLKVPVVLSMENQTLLTSHHRRGNLMLLQGQFVHTLWTGTHHRKVVLRHGPFVAHSHQFWNKPGWRVFRYGGTLAYETRRASLEAGFRQQLHIAPGLPDNGYWSLIYTRRF
jgi:hypothetical protein